MLSTMFCTMNFPLFISIILLITRVEHPKIPEEELPATRRFRYP
ncbi:hypothetical protein HMPREF9349_01787 [Escherichia coli MS 79-10]|nr:hypothetical protein HMPREF9349_01787 [Escherichia coli MS 79-10]